MHRIIMQKILFAANAIKPVKHVVGRKLFNAKHASLACMDLRIAFQRV